MSDNIKVKDLINMVSNTHGRKNYKNCNAKKVRENKKKMISIFSVRCFEEYSDPKGHFVGVKVTDKKNKLEDSEVKVMCTCEAWAYWGSEYHAREKKYKMKGLRGPSTDGSFPNERDPSSKNLVCKHVYLCLKQMLKNDARKNYGK